MSRVEIEHRRGTAAELHAADPFSAGPLARPTLWVCDVAAPAMVLGSRQAPDELDLDACAAAGLEVSRRRSGGGAVLLRPRAIVWIDVIIPSGIAPDDVRGSMLWIGDAWVDALAELGADRSSLIVHSGPMTWTPWSDLVCFAGIGPGEVVAHGRKLVGLSQRRTRHGIRVQCQLHRIALVGEMRALFAGPTPDVEIIEPALLADVLEPEPDDATLANALARALDAAIGQRIPPV